MAAVEYLCELRGAELRLEAAAALDGVRPEQRLDRVIDMLATAFTGPMFVAALELWVAARTDFELRDALIPMEARVGREMHRLTVDLLRVDETQPGVREAVQVTLDLLRGLGVANMLTDDSARRAALLAVWKEQLASLLRR